jgi:hypothetical protein
MSCDRLRNLCFNYFCSSVNSTPVITKLTCSQYWAQRSQQQNRVPDSSPFLRCFCNNSNPNLWVLGSAELGSYVCCSQPKTTIQCEIWQTQPVVWMNKYDPWRAPPASRADECFNSATFLNRLPPILSNVVSVRTFLQLADQENTNFVAWWIQNYSQPMQTM